MIEIYNTIIMSNLCNLTLTPSNTVEKVENESRGSLTPLWRKRIQELVLSF